jgi:hypothetical protein
LQRYKNNFIQGNKLSKIDKIQENNLSKTDKIQGNVRLWLPFPENG